MTPRRLRALQALAERGATEGEREAARIALEKHRAKMPRSSTHRTTSQARPKTGYVWGAWSPYVWSRRTHVDPSPARDEPKVVQYRPATPSDFPDIERAQDHTEYGVARIEVATNAEMHRRFHAAERFKFVWRGSVWEASQVNGYSHDRSLSRFYIHVHDSSMRAVKVPA